MREGDTLVHGFVRADWIGRKTGDPVLSALPGMWYAHGWLIRDGKMYHSLQNKEKTNAILPPTVAIAVIRYDYDTVQKRMSDTKNTGPWDKMQIMQHGLLPEDELRRLIRESEEARAQTGEPRSQRELRRALREDTEQ